MPIIEEAVKKFKFEVPEEIQLSCDTPVVVKTLTAIEKIYNLELAPVIIFFVVGDLTLEAIPDYLENNYELDEVTAKKLANELEEKILKPLLDRVNFLNEYPDKDMTLEQEKNYIENVFKKNLLVELTYDPIIKASVNNRLFFILARELNFKKQLEQALYVNEELLTSKPIIVNGQELKPTVSNWLKDFIARYGGQTYDSVSLSSFLINSENGKKLSADERRKLTDVLKIYTNIKFFPDSMPADEQHDWQIIPFEQVVGPILEELVVPEYKSKVTPVKSVPEVITKKDVRLDTPITTIKQEVTEPIISRTPIKTQSIDSAELTELKNMLLQYPVGSLQRAAIEEEIKLLQNK